MTSLQRDGDVFVLDLGSDENRFNGDSVAAIEACLDEVEAAPGPRALVTVASGKIWSNGLDLDWMGAHPDELGPFLHRLHGLFARLLAGGVPSVAALQGHTFAAGAMLALAHDLRVMRADRGFFCLPEVSIRIPFTPAMSALIQARLSPQAAHVAMTTGRRFGGDEAHAAGIVDDAVAEADVLPRALELAAGLAGHDAATLATIKARMYPGVLALLRDPHATAFAAD